MKAVFSSSFADRWQGSLGPRPGDLPPEAPLSMPVQAFHSRPGRYHAPATSPFNISNRRMLMFAATAALSCVCLTELVLVSMPGGINWAEAALLTLFAPLFAWIALSFCSAVAGFAALLGGRADGALLRDNPEAPRHRTALLVPIYNEDVQAVFRRIRAMIRSIDGVGASRAFDVFILSDSTDAVIFHEERLAFERLKPDCPLNLHYRRRPRNLEKKPGNIAEWVRRFGASYAYMVVLDADSVMSGQAMLQLADAMERHPDAGLIQSVPTVAGCTSLFGRWQQFAARLYGPVSTAGLIWWSGAEANFWGHNAIVRVRAFAESCGLPPLKGRAPLGGPIMSHDMVEAALLRRRGWGVHMVTLPEGSYEEYPPTLIDYAIRDRRWCQGNLQHLQLLRGRGLHWISRLHLLMGASAYFTSPLWAMLIAASLMQAAITGIGGGIAAPLASIAGWPLILTSVLLFGPKVLSLLWTLMDPQRRAAFGGARRLVAGVAADIPLAALLAPVVMVTQIIALTGLLAGKRGGWASQRRDVDAIDAREAFSRYVPHVTVGTILAGLCVAAPSLTLWLAPVIAGLLLAPVLVMLTSRRNLGLFTKRIGLFVTPEELAPPVVLGEATSGHEDRIPPLTHQPMRLPFAFGLAEGQLAEQAAG